MCFTRTMRLLLITSPRHVVIALAACITLSACASTSVSPQGPDLSAILEQVRQSSASAWEVEVPGIAAAVESETGESVGAVSGAADPPGSTPLTEVDRFHVGSLTKTFTAALIMTLDQEGQLSLDDPISRWLDYPGGDDITVRMLLGHTSGVPDFTSSSDLTRMESPDEAIALAARMEPLFAPDSDWSYSNTNYTMLGLIAERATSRTWADLVDSRFFQPLGLDDTYVWTGAPEGPTVNGARLACGESSEPACWPPQSGLAILPVDDGYDWTVAWAAGSVVSTPADIAKWMLALVGGDVLDASHRRLLTTPTPQSVASDFGEAVASLGAISGGGTLRWVGNGLGLFQYEIDGVGTAWGHEGTINGFVANAAYVASTGQGIAVTSNFAESDSFSALGAVAITASAWSEKAP